FRPKGHDQVLFQPGGLKSFQQNIVLNSLPPRSSQAAQGSGFLLRQERNYHMLAIFFNSFMISYYYHFSFFSY
ncbi:MAG TPA: hypothetical protein PLB50_07130, partial [Candidatus Saccharicenans sp.]|nr:hypothetical protein [Candidatus Saccharicenans sp.]HUM79776.1 hypothetical protein [Candidatus Saccharicenans sp.]